MYKLEVKASLSVDDAGTITGTAWPFGSADRVGDIITKGAFNSPERLPMLFAHDQAQAVGIWDSITETSEGLTVKGRLLIEDVARAREVRALVREGAVTGLSIGFVTKQAAGRKGGGRTITALDLHEISIVPIPSHPGARITTAKAANLKGGLMPQTDEEAAPDYAAIETKVADLATEVKAIAKVTDRLDKLEAKVNRPAIVVPANDNGGVEKKAFMSFVRSGQNKMAEDELKSLTVANDTAIAPDEFGSELIKLLREYSPVRQYARVITIGAKEIKYPRRTTSTAATWVGETDDRTASEPGFEQIGITPFELATFTDISTQLLEDNAYNLEGELLSDYAESFGKAEGTAFVKGSGTGQPKGLMTATGIAEVKTGVAADFPTTYPADVLIGMFHKLPGVHAQRSAWLMNRTTLGVIRTWKDGNGRYLVSDPISEGAPITLLGRPVVEMLDMDDIGANKYPIMFGDLQGYRIVDRIGLSVLRDPYSLATKGQVRFHARKRVGADVTHPDRFVKLKVAA